MTGISTSRVNEWIYGLLSSDATLTSLAGGRVFPEQAPPGQSYPLVIYQQVAGTVLKGLGGIEIWTDLVYLVKAVDLGTTAINLEAIVSRIIALLDNRRGAAGTGQVFFASREQELAYSEPTPQNAPARYWHLGSTYRVLARNDA